MKSSYHLIISLFFLSFFSYAYCQKSNIQLSEPSVIYSTDTIYSIDTITIPLDSSLIKITKAKYDSLVNAARIASKKESTRPVSNAKESDLNLFKEISFLSSDYESFAIESGISYKNTSLQISTGFNNNSTLPFIGGLSIEQKFEITNNISLAPKIMGLWYIPTNANLPVQNNNHLGVKLSYLAKEDLEISIFPSVYCAWRNNLNGNPMYNEVIHMISPYKPFYAKETSSNSTFDIGLGLGISIKYKFK